MAADLAKEATPSGTPFGSCCSGPYVSSCSGKICFFPLHLHLLPHCSFSCPVENKEKSGDKQEMLGLDLGLVMSKVVVGALRLFAGGCPTWGFLLLGFGLFPSWWTAQKRTETAVMVSRTGVRPPFSPWNEHPGFFFPILSFWPRSTCTYPIKSRDTFSLTKLN